MYIQFVQPDFGYTKITDLKRTDVRDFYNMLADERNLKANTIDNIHTVLLISLGIKETEIDTTVEEHEMDTEPQETLDIFQSMGQQLRFWQDIGVKVSLIKEEISRLDDEINTVLNYIEGTNYNAAQGYKVYKVLRDKQIERKALVKELMEEAV